MNRRRFLTCTLGATGLGVASWKTAHALGLKKVTRSSQALGSQVHLSVHAASRSRGEDAIDAALAAIERVESLMSLYRADSQLCQLNRVGVLEAPAPELLEVITTAKQLSEDTDGAFDITVQPLWELHARSSPPSPTDLAAVRERIGWQNILIEPLGIQLDKGAQITLNGIAQGYAADAARKALADHGIEHAILDAGEVSTLGEHLERGHWAVGIKHPRKPGLIGVAQLDGRCMATSGDYETRFHQDQDAHHLFDPRTGSSANLCSSVSVMAPSSMQADALSTACFVLGVERGMEFIEQSVGADALFIAKDGAITRSRNFPVELS